MATEHCLSVLYGRKKTRGVTLSSFQLMTLRGRVLWALSWEVLRTSPVIYVLPRMWRLLLMYCSS